MRVLFSIILAVLSKTVATCTCQSIFACAIFGLYIVTSANMWEQRGNFPANYQFQGRLILVWKQTGSCAVQSC